MQQRLKQKLASSTAVDKVAANVGGGVDQEDNDVLLSLIDEKTTTSTTKTPKQHKPSRVIYLGHLPQFFEEEEIVGFLSQFGTVQKCRISRSRRSGRPRGYGYVQFQDADVTQIVAQTMSGYLLSGKRVVCHVLPSDKIHQELFRGAGTKWHSHADQTKKARAHEIRTTLRSRRGVRRLSRNMSKRDEAKRRQLAQLGIDYDYPKVEVDEDEEDSDTDDDDDDTTNSENENDEEGNKIMDPTSLQKLSQSMKGRDLNNRKKLAELGIDYDYPKIVEDDVKTNTTVTEMNAVDNQAHKKHKKNNATNTTTTSPKPTTISTSQQSPTSKRVLEETDKETQEATKNSQKSAKRLKSIQDEPKTKNSPKPKKQTKKKKKTKN